MEMRDLIDGGVGAPKASSRRRAPLDDSVAGFGDSWATVEAACAKDIDCGAPRLGTADGTGAQAGAAAAAAADGSGAASRNCAIGVETERKTMVVAGLLAKTYLCKGRK